MKREASVSARISRQWFFYLLNLFFSFYCSTCDATQKLFSTFNRPKENYENLITFGVCSPVSRFEVKQIYLDVHSSAIEDLQHLINKEKK